MIAGSWCGKTTSIGQSQVLPNSKTAAAAATLPRRRPQRCRPWRAQQREVIAPNRATRRRHFDAVSAARARGIDIVVADTRRPPADANAPVDEIAKVRRCSRITEGPHETLLVLDANIGQNALAQVRAFDKAISVSGLVVTKLDGTAKGGVVAAIARQCPKPIRFIGVGEQIDDLRPFSARDFVDALFEQ
jgi:fused signal recognition particle receptor